jgi:hypothetical protein
MWISNSNLFKNVFSVTILIVTIYSILPYPSPLNNTIVNIRNTTFWWILIFFSLAFFWFSKRYFFDIRNTTNLKVIKWYLLWNIFNILRGFWAVENYWDMKGLVENSMVL